MIKKREKRIRKLRKNHVWITIAAFIVVFIIGAIVMMAFSEQICWYIVDSKIYSQYTVVKNMEAIYSETVRHESYDIDQLERTLALSSDSFAVLDNNGNVIMGNDYADLGSEDGSFTIQDSTEKITLYKSDLNDLLYVENGQLKPSKDMKKLFKYAADQINSESMEDVDRIQDEDDEIVMSSSEFEKLFSKNLNLPLWLAKTADNGDVIVSKCLLNLSLNDFMLILKLMATMFVIAYFVFIILIVSVIVTVSNQKKNFNLYFKDTITGGNNRNMYLYNGEKMLKKRRNLNRTYTVVSLEFVKYNAFCLCHSMDAGEEVLTRMYKCLKANMNKGEIAAHMTIAEFALLLYYLDTDSLTARLHKIIDELDDIDPDHNFVFHVGVKIVPPAREDPSDPRRKDFDLELEYNNACTARMPRDDKDDNKIYFFDQKLIDEQHWEDKISECQSKAIDNDEFVIYYQPKYDPNTDKLTGAEALIRWNSPDLGFVSPGRFIPQFEKSGFITEIDHYMLKHVAMDQKKWLDSGYECVPVSVNVSRAHFIESDLAEQIKDIVDAAGAPRNLLEIELTESAFFDDKNALISTIQRLQDYGFTVSMDDFGSGFSSLNSLKDLPLDVLKLDAGFFSGDISDDRSGIVVSETIRLAKSLNMKTVAEGVELKEQVEFLAAKGCDMIQGYYYSKPLPEGDFVEKLKS